MVSAAEQLTAGFRSDRWIVQVDEDDYSELLQENEEWNRDIFDVVGRSGEGKRVELLTGPCGYEILMSRFPTSLTLFSPDEMKDRDVDPQYMDYEEVVGLLQWYEDSYPEICELHEAGTSHEGRTVWAAKVSDNVGDEEDEPSVMIMGLHHAREIMSTEIAMDVLEYLTAGYGGDPDVNEWVNELQIWVMPMVNPDGSAYCWTEDMWWTKNRRENYDGSYGVNLDHNYPFLWGECFGSSSDPGSSGYRGTEAGSEPEVQAVMNLAETVGFEAALSYHSFDELLIMPYGCRFWHTPDRYAVDEWGRRIAAGIRREDGGYGYDSGVWWEVLYPTDGVETDWFYAMQGTFCWQIEVNAGSYYPPYSIRNQTVSRNRAGWMTLFDLILDGPMVRGHIVDECTGEPLSAVYSFEEAVLENGETPRTSDPVYGSFLYPAYPSSFHFLASAEGYADRRMFMTIGDYPITLLAGLMPLDEYGLLYVSHTVYDQEGDNDRVLDPGETSNLMVALKAPAWGISGISAQLSTQDPYVTIITDTAYFDDIEGGRLGWTLNNGFRIQASAAAPENHVIEFLLTLYADEPLCDDQEIFSLGVCSYMDVCPLYLQSFDSDPDWDIQNTGTGGWEFGTPQSGPGQAYTGDCVYGTNLDGNYGNDGLFKLTSQSFDCTGVTQTELRFRRWLHNENNYDKAWVMISANGLSWDTLYEGYESDGEWMEMIYDISSIADEEESVYLRFVLESDYIYSYEGFYIDDVAICSRYEGQVPPTFIPTETPMPTYPGTRTPSPTPTDTPTQSPTHTVTSTWTFSPTNTPTSTATPILTLTPTNTPTCSPTLAETPPTAAPSLSPTPTDYFFTDLQLNQDIFRAGDLFILNLFIEHMGEDVLVQKFVIFDVWGDYFFWPDWSRDADWVEATIQDGYSTTQNILTFVWPVNAGEAYGLKFWAGCLEKETGTLIGNIDSVIFSYE